MTTLFCTLGASWAVVPEAFLLGNGPALYDRVLVLTTSGTGNSVASCRAWFATHHPDVELSLMAVADLPDLATAAQHHQFEEALYRCYFHALAHAAPGEIHACLAGGFKTMSAAVQEAAGLLGCGKLLHVMAPSNIRTDTHEEILAHIQDGTIRCIDLGARAGWPTMLELAGEAPPLPPGSGPLSITGTALRDAIHNRLQAANRLAASEHELATLPFPQIARWSPARRDWLRGPLHPDADHAWLLALPKVELHCHLGGFATHGPLLAAVRAAAAEPHRLPPLSEPPPPTGWPLPPTPIGLEAYRQLGDATGSAILRDPGCLAKHLQLLYRHFQDQNIHYAEIRCSPANYAAPGRSAWDVLTDIRHQLLTCQETAAARGEPAPLVNLIIIATRQSGGDFRTPIVRHLALAATASGHWTDERRPRVVGVDLAGFENKDTRAHYYREDFMAALRLGLGITAHAGENDDAEGIWSAILDLNARRLGHALHLASSPTLLQTVADRRIGIEMCPFANLQIIGFPLDAASLGNPASYPLLTYLQAGVPVTVNTDNIGISHASLTENLRLLPRLCPGITRLHILQLLRHAVDQSFLTIVGKNQLLAAMHIPH